MAEVAKHTCDDEGKEDVWIVVGNAKTGGPKVIDISSYLDDHPGGKEVMMDLAGKNADEMFEDIGHSNEARKKMKSLVIGDLKLSEAEKKALEEEAERKKIAAESGMGMMPFLVIIIAFAAFMYAKNNGMM
eukprot:CAMPEP_0114341396 /NCGR_PEP_ID=MMETSP0101-20121206/9021_1 /TAXON_ID=38822 ORGANISM="Pteridomonas danica, Strain PT" /NCGR_SAMPLE_ID=MMETSP0101 /ASSEMBLY_ACC=CAM_ASM_000211 /LENGTH=130 /DNA_ID=CAMNT_0001474989 /DNA_START=82 /DNA_END=474 /DNA_ORIENTATION=+